MRVKKVGLLRSTMTVSFFTMISRLLGFLRDVLVARLFGVGPLMDAFLVAFKIPNFMRRLFAEGGFSQAFVPILSEYQENKSEEELRDFLAVIAGTLSMCLCCIVILVEITAPWWIYIFAPGFYDEPIRFEHAYTMLRWTFPYLAFISIAAFTGSILNTFSKYAIPAATPILLNVVMIVFVLFVCPHVTVPIHALAQSVFVAGIVQCIFQWPFLVRMGLYFRPRIDWQNAAVKRLLKQMVPALFGVSVSQVNLLLDTLFASFLPVGSITWLYYSDRLMNFPLGVFGVAISTVILPPLSRAHAASDTQSYERCLDWSLRTILLIGLPSAAGLIMLAEPLLVTLFNYGAFHIQDVQQTALSLMAFSIGVPVFMLLKVLASSFYSKQDIKTPVRVGALAMITNAGLNLILMGPLKHAGLALATTVAAYLNAVVLLLLLKRRGWFHFERGWFRYLGHLALALLVMCLFLMEVNTWLDLHFWLTHSFPIRLISVLGTVASAAVIYLSCLFVFGYRLGQFRHFAVS